MLSVQALWMVYSQQLGSRTAHFCSALGQQSWGPEAAAIPAPPVPLGFSLISAIVVTTQEGKEKVNGILKTLCASWQ